jgi:hypothetical protein
MPQREPSTLIGRDDKLARHAIHGVAFTAVSQAQKFLDPMVARSSCDPSRPVGQGHL